MTRTISSNSRRAWALAVGLALTQGIGLFTYVPAVSLITHWIPLERQGLALGVMMTGISVGGIVFPVLLSRMAADLGWRNTHNGIAVLVLLVCVPLLLWLARMPPVRAGGERAPTAALAVGPGIGAGQATPGTAAISSFAILWGSTFNLANQLSPTMLKESMGERNFGTLLGIGNLISGIGASFGPMMFGRLVDITHSYSPPLVLCSILMLAALPLILWLQRNLVPPPSTGATLAWRNSL